MKKGIMLWILIFVSTAIFFIIEWRYPLFFLQDDNYCSYLPNVTHVWRSLFQGGELSQYNFHQYLGVATLSMGQNAVLYPLNYLSIGLSLLFTGDFYWTVDIYAYIHIMVGIIGMFILLKHIKVNSYSAFFGSIIWGFSNYTWFVGNAWSTILPIIMYLPFMIYFSLRLFETLQKKWIVALVVTRLLSFFVGHSQFFVYTCLVEILFITLLVYRDFKQGKKHNQFIKLYLLSYVGVFFLSLPLLLPMLHQMQISGTRSSALGIAEVIGQVNWLEYMSGLVFPHHKEGSISTEFGKIAFVGIIPIGICIAYFIYSIWLTIKNKRYSENNKWLNISSKLLVFYFLWSMGILALIFYIIPILNRFRWAFKNIIFVNFFIALVASIILSEITKKLKYRKLILTIIIIIQIGGSIYALGFDKFFSWGERNEDIPYSTEVIDKIDDNKVITFGFNRNAEGILPSETLLNTNATFFEKYNFNGYEILLTQKQIDTTFDIDSWSGLPYINNTYGADRRKYTDEELTDIIEKLREWGVKWYITSNDYIYPQDFGFIEEYNNDRLTLYRDPQAKSIFYFTKDVEPIISYDIGYNSIKIKIDTKTDDNLIVNFIYNPFFNAFIDGEEIELGETELGQILLNVPAGEHEILIKYSDPYFVYGCYASCTFLILILVIICLKKKGKKENI